VIRQYRKSREWEEGTLLEKGFTLIELLIVIVVLGILAATVIFALGGVTGQSAQAACQSDAKSVEVAVEAYHSFPANSANKYPNKITDLLTGGPFGQFLHAAPSNTKYTIGLVNDTNGPGGGTGTSNTVYVTANAGPASATPGVDYDTEAPSTPGPGTGCNAIT
jgi:prepilin-type N-terminal cleavage/methylation domain-containing protein